MKIGKTLHYLVYIFFIMILTYHFSLFFSLFFPCDTFSFIRPISIFEQLKPWQTIIYIVLILLSLFLSTLIALQSNQLETMLAIPRKKNTIQIGIIDVILFFLILSPVFYTYDNSFLYSLSENEKIRYLVIFLCVFSLLSSLFAYYADLYVKKKEAEHNELRQRMMDENNILKQQIDEENALLKKWQEDIEVYSEQLQKLDGVSKETADYYNSIQKSFQMLKSKED